jgi:hypothetical protein
MSNLVAYAKSELEAAGLFSEESVYGGEIGKAVMELMEVFAKQGHSGGSAPKVAYLFQHLANYKPLSPITGEDQEWMEAGEGVFQNRRCLALFKKGKDGKPYYLNAIIWREEDDGSQFTGTVEGIPSRQFVRLPFTPKSFYVIINKDRKIVGQVEFSKAVAYYDMVINRSKLKML